MSSVTEHQPNSSERGNENGQGLEPNLKSMDAI